MTGAPWPAPPDSYERWLACLSALEEGPVPREALALLARGTLPQREMTAYFQPRLTRAVNAMLRRCVRRLNRQMRQAAEWGEPEEAVTALRRFCRAAEDCLFFRTLEFLPLSYRRELASAVEEGVRNCWAEVDRWLRRAYADGDPRMEELRRPLRRLRPGKTG